MNKIKIFIVDDESMAIRHFKRMICRGNDRLQVVGEALSGKQAIGMIGRLAPDIVFIDVCMPGMDGLELTALLRRDYPEIKIILLSSYKEFSYVQKGITLGISGYFVKHEVTAEQIVQKISELFRESSLEKEKSRIYFEKNVRKFLLSEDGIPLKIGYAKEKGQHYACISIFCGPKIGFRSKQEREFDFHELDLEKEVSDENITCRAAVRMSPCSCCAILYIKNLVSEKLIWEHMQDIVKKLQGRFAFLKEDPAFFISPVTADLAELPGFFREQRRCEPYIYAYRSFRSVFYRDDYLKIGTAGERINIWKLRDMIQLESKDFTSSEKDLKQLLEKSKKCCTQEQYLGIVYAIYQQIASLGERYHAAARRWEKQTDREFRNTEELEAWIFHILRDLYECTERNGKNKYSIKVRMELDYIRKNYAVHMSEDDISKYLDISGSHLRRIFQRETGLRVTDYLAKIRIEKAKELLESSQYSIDEVYEMVGFTSREYFSVVFKKITGESPGRYQRGKNEQHKT